MKPRARRWWGWLLALVLGAASLTACGAVSGGGGPAGTGAAATGQGGGPVPAATKITFNGGPPSVLPTVAPGAQPTDLPACRLPRRLATPSWVPPDLPLPPGTYLSERLPQSIGYSRGIFVVPGSLTDLARYVLGQWPRHGWILGRGDAEPGEVEDQFSKPPSVGAFKAQSQYCAPGYNLMLLIFAPDRSKIGSGPGTQPRSPLPSPST